MENNIMLGMERAEMTAKERADILTAIHGEVCTYSQAARMLGRNVKTIRAMLEDGRLDEACTGTRVDVRSIARYIMEPKQEDHIARQRRKGRTFAV